MRKFAGITEPLEQSTCPSVISIWSSIDRDLIAGLSAESEDKLAYRLIALAQSRPTVAWAMMKLIILKPATETSTGDSYGKFL